MKYLRLILILTVLLLCSGCLTVKKLSIMNGLFSVEYVKTAVPTVYKIISYEKTAEGKAFDLLHAERDPSTFGSEENPETPVISP